MLPILLIVILVLALPLAARAVRMIFRAHLFTVVLFLPAGLALRYGLSQDLRVLACVTCLWALLMAKCVLTRRPTEPA